MVSTSSEISSFIPVQRPPRLSYDVCLTPLHTALSTNDVISIIRDKALFWTAFCQEASKLEGTHIHCFHTLIAGDKITISGIEHIHKNLQNIVEVIRNLFAVSLDEKRGVTIVPIDLASDIFICEKADCIDLTRWLIDDRNKIFCAWFKSFIRPCLPGLSEILAAKFSEETIGQSFMHEPGVPLTESVTSITIEWLPGSHYVYPILPKAIAKRADAQESMYAMYQQQIYCDFSIVAKEGVVKMHSLPLFMHGGAAIQTLLTSGMKETLEKTINFSHFSLSTVEAFVDFIYLGEKTLTPDSIDENNVNLIELFELANIYQIQPLIDSCTNLFSLVSTADDIKTIVSLSVTYDNDHLKKLCEHYLPKNAA